MFKIVIHEQSLAKSLVYNVLQHNHITYISIDRLFSWIHCSNVFHVKVNAWSLVLHTTMEWSSLRKNSTSKSNARSVATTQWPTTNRAICLVGKFCIFHHMCNSFWSNYLFMSEIVCCCVLYHWLATYQLVGFWLILFVAMWMRLSMFLSL